MPRTARPRFPETGDRQLLPLRRLLLHSSFEALLTSILLFGIETAVRFVIGPSRLSRAIPEMHGELLVVGAIVGLLVAALIASKPGKASGGHMNPAITLAMWRIGRFPGRAVLPYAAAQFAGSLLGVLAARGVWGSTLAARSVDYGALRPGSGWSGASLFAVEAASMGVIILLVGLSLSVRRLTAALPWVVGGLVGAAIAGLGTYTGGSDNPARQFGPAIFAAQYGFLAIYLIAPLVGATLAAWLLPTLCRCALTRRPCRPSPNRTGFTGSPTRTVGGLRLGVRSRKESRR
jgi:glycerol uptake facilitator-like aquaporin